MPSFHKLFPVPLPLIVNVSTILKNHQYNQKQVDIYDDETTRYTVEDELLLQKIRLLCFYSNENIDMNKCTVHYIKYNIDNRYIIKKHTDRCEKTFIFYLEKDPKIQDHFYVEDEYITDTELWTNRGLAMNQEAQHWGEYSGSGSRSILCVFYN